MVVSEILELEKTAPAIEKERDTLTEKLRQLPREAFTKMRMLQPEDGCGGQCPNCSQSAQPDIWSLTDKGLTTLIESAAIVAKEVAGTEKTDSPLVGYGRKTRPDTIFPYLDNDVGSYPLLDRYLSLISSKLGAKAKITTIGWSRHNSELQEMHERINRNLLHTLTAVSFSLTSYTQALWHPNRGTSSEEYKADLANALRTYRPAIDRLGTGKESGGITLRFKPLVSSYEKDMDDLDIDGYHVVHSGPYLIVNKTPGNPEEAKTDFSTGTLGFTQPATDCIVLISDEQIDQDNWQSVAKETVNNLANGGAVSSTSANMHVEEAKVYLLENQEGHYYAVNPDFQPDGSFNGKYFYHKTDKRPRSGYNDSQRFFLNALLEYKKLMGFSVNEQAPNATWNDVNQVIQLLHKKALEFSAFDKKAGNFISTEITPLAETLAEVLQMAGYEPSFFFDPNFPVDTGQILNQGRSISDFKGLTKTPNLATNPQHERAIHTWNNTSVWRWTITPSPQPSITVQELDPATFTSDIGPNGEKLEKHVIKMEEETITHIRGRENLISQKRIPGVVLDNTITQETGPQTEQIPNSNF